MEKQQIKERLEAKAEKGTMIMAHRGVCGSNIVDNTIESFELALKQGADILEMDVFRSLDGRLYVFHDGTEAFMLNTMEKVIEMTSAQIDKLRYVNKNGFRLEHRIHTLDEVLEHFKGRCLINLDRCWWCWQDVFKAVLQHGVENQIIFKSAPERRYLSLLEDCGTPFLYMPIIWYPEELERIDRTKINMAAVEFIGHSRDAAIMRKDFVQGLRKQGIHCMISSLTLGNPIYEADKYMQEAEKRNARVSIVDGNFCLSGGHDDDVSLLESPDEGWGWLIENGFNIIQTDWTRELSLYLEERRRRGLPV